MKQATFAAACKEYFGLKPGQAAIDFMKEIRELTLEDRADLTKMFPSVGYEIINNI